MKRFWIPLTLTILVICLIEVGINSAFKPHFWDKTTWLLHDPYRSEPFDRLVVEEKIIQLIPLKPDIISVGDSSGLFAVQPNIINRYLHGLKYVSFSTGANQAFDGYKAILLYVLKHQPSVKYVVLNMYPNLVPSPQVFRVADLAPILYDNLVGIKAKVTPPSAAISPFAKNEFFYGEHYDPSAYPSSHKVALEARDTFANTLGWLPEHDVRFNRISRQTPMFPDREKRMASLFGLFERPALAPTLQEFVDICRDRHVKLMIMFDPMAWQTIAWNDDMRAAQGLLEKFQRDNPDVIFLTDHLVTPWDPAKFGMYNHISREYVFEGSARMGMAIEKAIFKPELVRPFHAEWTPQRFNVPEDVVATGAATDEQVSAALAYYLYAASLNSQNWSQLSSRVQGLLTGNQAFNWMIEDSTERVNLLKEKKIELTYDSSHIRGDIVSLKNGYYCGNGKDVTWVLLSGYMQFNYRSPVQETSEPVEWPATSNIIIPIIKENGHYVFDGYCPAPLETYRSTP